MKTWEYTSISLFGVGSQDELDAMSRLGAEGWELASTIHLEDEARAVHYFKRPIADRWHAEREDITGAEIELALTGENGEEELHVVTDAVSQQAAAQNR